MPLGIDSVMWKTVFSSERVNLARNFAAAFGVIAGTVPPIMTAEASG
ncbi:hypothetical protein LV82_02626 [Albidovulum inexpectatum]|uniref:Uncharacterized protein n=1 Tax=Albidovulum inexpectatum TaxID=196587 RepID=A0A2S5JEE4_9RHOB|nr:hypothetical protein LV82_02626 [Albidovulum inexpectatum]